MSHLDTEIELLKENILELMYLVKGQLEKGQKALYDFDRELAHEIIANEKRVDSLELTIDRDCENILALFNPVAVDLRFVMAAFKVNADLERIGDHADSIAKYILDFGHKVDRETLDKMHIPLMYDTALKMVDNVFHAFTEENTELARGIFKLDEDLNQINQESSKITSMMIADDPQHTREFLYLFSIIRKLERCGDLTKNVAEELIFYIEAKVLKHQTLKSKQNSGSE